MKKVGNLSVVHVQISYMYIIFSSLFFFLSVLGGLVEDRILSRAKMQEAAKLPSLDVMRGELLTILSTSACKTSSLLGKHQTELSSILTQLVKERSIC